MNSSLVPFLSRSSLFVRGMAAQCPAVQVLAAHAGGDDGPAGLVRERVIELLVRAMPWLPLLEGSDIDDLAALSREGIAALALGHLDAADMALYRRWRAATRSIGDGDVRDFAELCAILLTEIYRRAAGLRQRLHAS